VVLPHSFVVRLNPRTRILDGGAALLGGSPARYVRLSAQAQACLHNREVRVTNDVSERLADTLLNSGMADPAIDRLPQPAIDYTVVIPVMNRPRELSRVLESIVKATEAQGCPRIIVVDDASASPATTRRIASQHGAEFLGLTTNVGPAGARNAGLAEVDTELVVFLDSDLVIGSDTIPLLVKHFLDPQVAMASPRIMGLRQGNGWIARFEEARSSLDLGPIAGPVRPLSRIAWTSSAVMVARVSALGTGFDTSMRVGEDVDLVWRLCEAGWRVRYEPASIARHENREKFGTWFKRKHDYGTSAVPLASKHPESIAPAIIAPWGVALVIALLFQRKWSLPVAGGILTWRLLRSARQLSSAAHPEALAARVTVSAVGTLTSQASDLMLKHWWPLTVIGCLFSRRIRRATLAVAVTDALLDHSRVQPQLDPIRYGAAKTLADIAYGSGVWLASIRARRWTALTPQIFRRSGIK
jgi:mycofactocin system glycosyltransferase